MLTCMYICTAFAASLAGNNIASHVRVIAADMIYVLYSMYRFAFLEERLASW